jgi:hypothetical protein
MPEKRHRPSWTWPKNGMALSGDAQKTASKTASWALSGVEVATPEMS